MDTKIDLDDITIKTESMDTTTCLKNLNDIKTTTNKKTLSDEDLDNFKNSISYVCKILVV